MRTLFAVLCLTLIPAVGCPGNIIIWDPPPILCTTLFAYGVSATVTNTDTNQPITNAVLTLHEGDYVETMEAFPAGGYIGAGERQGDYLLTIAIPA